MKKNTRITALVLLVVFASMTFSSCATVFCGPVSTYQKTKPLPGQPSREVRVGYLILDLVLGVVPAVVDFATGAIYQPQPVQVPLAPATQQK